MSFSLTADQMLARTKRVTRRQGWEGLTAGAVLKAVERSRGLKPWTPRVDLGVIQVVAVTLEPLELVTDEDVELEGFQGMGREGFLAMLWDHLRLKPSTMVRRVEFRFLGDELHWSGFKLVRRGQVFEARVAPEPLRAVLPRIRDGRGFTVEALSGPLEVPPI